MPYSSTEDRRIIIRMTQEDRQSINRIIQHKRDEFENIMRRGIVSMLNAQVERQQLADQRSEYLKFFTKRNQHRKDQMSSVTTYAKEASSTAPMGIGVAANLALTATNSIGSAVLDNVEDRRKETEVQEQLYSAQMLHYISSKDYENIATEVASTLSYRFQFLLFRLASGENGYMKLALFLLDSMKSHAIDRLREHKNNVAKALLDAAIPPSTDAISYRDWPQINFSKFKFQHRLALHKSLALDEDANQIIARCGPAVRALLGGYQHHVEASTGKVKYHSPYTIIGALNHASILNSEGGLFKGLETPHRKGETLDGTMKYPLILLAVGETTADLGVNFATKATGEFLENAHVVALTRLVPSFFQHQVAHKHTPKGAANPSLAIINNADLRYQGERLECPWTPVRERVWQERLQCLYQVDDSTLEAEEVVTVNDEKKLRAMKIASNIFDAQEAKKNVLKVTQEAMIAQIEVNDAHAKTALRSMKQLEAARASKYAALATSELMECIMNCNALDDEYFTLAIGIIEAANGAFNASRSSPLDETNRYLTMINASNKASQHADTMFEFQYFCRSNIQLVSRIIKKSTKFASTEQWFDKERTIHASITKILKSQIREHVQESLKLTKLSRMMAEHGKDDHQPLHQTAALSEFYQAADEARVVLDRAGIPDPAAILKIIKCCVLETEKNRDKMKLALLADGCELADEHPPETARDRHDIKNTALEAATAAHLRATTALENANDLIETMTLWQRNIRLDDATKARLLSYQAAAALANAESIALVRRIKYALDGELASDINTEVNAFFARAAANDERGMLRFIASKHADYLLNNPPDAPVKTRSQLQLEEALLELDRKVRHLNLAIKADHAHRAEAAYLKIAEEADALSDAMSFQDIEKQARIVRQSRMVVERAITHDIEIGNFAINKAQLALNESEHVEQTIDEMKERLITLKRACLATYDAMDNASTGDPKSEGLATPTDLKQLEELDHLSLVITALEAPPSMDSPAQPSIILNTLLELINRCTVASSHLHIPQAEIKHKILTSIAFLKQEISQGATGLTDHWEIWLIAELMEWVMQTLGEMEHGITFQITEAMKALKIIRQIANEESPILISTRDLALQTIKKAYTDIAAAKERKIELEKNPHGQERLKWGLVRSTLAWSARLTDPEHKWLEKQRAAKYPGSLIIGSQSPRASKAYLVMLTYSRGLLDEKAEELRRLNRLSVTLKQCQKQLYDLGQTDIKDGIKKTTTLDKRHQWLDKLVNIKRTQAENQRNDIDTLRKSILQQGLRIFFMEWHKKTHNPHDQDIRTLALKAAEKERHPSRIHKLTHLEKSDEKRKENLQTKQSNEKNTMFPFSDPDLKFKNDAENNTIDDLEIRVETLKKLLMPPNPNIKIKSNDSSRDSLFDSRKGSSVNEKSPLTPSPTIGQHGLFVQSERHINSSSSKLQPKSGVLVQIL
jgi:hypothetical protein